MIEHNKHHPVVDYEDIYAVTYDGTVFNTKTGRKLKPNKNSQNGYYYLGLSRNGISKSEYLHRIIAKAWIPNHNNYKYVNHINGIRTDNRVENLEWCTKSHDLQHAYSILGRAPPRNRLGKPKPKGSGTQPRCVRGTHLKNGKVLEFESMADAARYFSGCYQNILQVCRGRRKSAYGYRWEYLD